MEGHGVLLFGPAAGWALGTADQGTGPGMLRARRAVLGTTVVQSRTLIVRAITARSHHV